MKTNGFSILIAALLWLFNLNPAHSQAIQDYFSEQGQVIIPTQVDKNPADLFNVHLAHSLNVRNAIKSSSSIIQIQPDSIIYYSGTLLNIRETYTYDLSGNLINYLKETWNGYDWANSELNSFIYNDDGHVLTELKLSWINFYWEKTYLLNYSYNHWGNLESYLIQKWEFNRWNNYDYISYTYDDGGRMLSCLEQAWNSEEWQNLVLSSNHYDEKGYLDKSVRQIWDGTTWVNSSRNENLYNNAGNLVSSLSQNWDGNDWLNTDLHTFTYDEAGNMLSHLMQFYWENWINFQLVSYTYDGSGNNLTYFEQSWGEADWVNSKLITRTFNQDGCKLSEMTQEWLNTWNNISNSAFTYDENYNCLSATWFNWANNSWENSMKVEYEYPDGLITGRGFNWDGSGWVNGDAMLDLKINVDGTPTTLCNYWGSRAELYYTALYTGTPEPVEEYASEYSVYPNPANQVLYVLPQFSENIDLTINVFDLSGKKIESIPVQEVVPGSQAIELNTSNLAPGIYILGLNSGTTVHAQKFNVSR